MFLTGVLKEAMDNNEGLFKDVLLGKTIEELNRELNSDVVIECIYTARKELATRDRVNDFVKACQSKSPQDILATFQRITFTPLNANISFHYAPKIALKVNKLSDTGIDMYQYFHEYFDFIHGGSILGWINSKS